MKNVLVLTLASLLSLSSLSAQADAIGQFFEKYSNNSEFTQINISPKMFEMFSQMDKNSEMDDETQEMIKSLKGLKILTTESNPRQYYKEFISKVNTTDYEELMTIRDGDSDVKFLVKDSDGGNIVNELLLLVGGDDDFVLMSFVGKIPLDKVGKLAKNINISGSEHLEKLKNKK